MRYAKIRKMDISNGEGIGVSLFVQGCHFHCKGCFNTETWDFSGGKEWNSDVSNKFCELAGKPYVQRISILGGEPLADENAEEVARLIHKLSVLYPGKEVWLYTGYITEDIAKHSLDSIEDHHRAAAVLFADVVVDGPFQMDKQDLYNEKIIFAGSTNQRILRKPEVADLFKKYQPKRGET